MKKVSMWKERGKRATSLFLSVMLCLMTFFPYLSSLQVLAAEKDTVTLTTAHGDFGGTHKLYCIDKGGLAIWGIADDGDVYKKHRPSEAEVPLSKKEQEYIFCLISIHLEHLWISEKIHKYLGYNYESNSTRGLPEYW